MPKKLQTEEIIYSKEVIEFITVANEFCNIMENLNTQSREEFINNIYKILTLIQLKSVLLPKIEFSSGFGTESFVNEADWHFFDNAVSEKLGSFEIYSNLREPLNPESSSEVTLSECIADTYQDLKDLTQNYQISSPDAILQSIAECKTNFEQYWGPRIMLVIREFHLLIYGNSNLSDDSNEVEKADNSKNNWLNDIFE